jgi:OmpA-OmpF porin, OOP family
MNPRLRSNIFIYSSVVAAGLLGVALLLRGCGSSPETSAPPRETDSSKSEQKPITEVTPPQEPVNPPQPEEEIGPEGLVATDPAQILQRIAAAFQKGDLSAAEKMIGQTALSPELRARLDQLNQSGKLKPRAEGAVQEIGELELGKRTRWAIWLDGAPAGQDRIFFELEKKGSQWAISSLTLPPADGVAAGEPAFQDSLGIADVFLQSVLRQDFARAKKFTDTRKISDATIAGLCILFEEGSYRLRPERPLRVLLQREDTTGYLANVQASDGQTAAEFSLILTKAPAGSPAAWLVTELDLDKLLADYAQRVAGGDVYYTPLVKNPKGGDTLVLYFDFNEGELGARSIRQLEIVASILRTDVGKKLNLSGHTDALGSAEYNQGLSSKRAEAVKDYLVRHGVDASQIVTEAEGARQPRRPNFTESGADNPEGRRANRRTEIYLDF